MENGQHRQEERWKIFSQLGRTFQDPEDTGGGAYKLEQLSGD